MPVRRAIATGNWSSTSTWTGGILPSDGDTVVSNGFNVTIDTDVSIGGVNNPSVNAGSFVIGQWYEITFIGTTSFPSIGAANNNIGTVFQANNIGSGTGTANARATISTAAVAGSANGGNFLMPTVQVFTADVRAGGVSSALTLSATTGTLLLSDLIIAPGSGTTCHGINVTSTAGVSLTGCRLAGASAVGPNSHYLQNTSTATITATNCVLATDGTSGGVIAINNASTGNVIVSDSSITATAGSSGVIGNSSTGSISISNCTLNSTGIRPILINASTGSVTISGSTISSPSATNSALSNTTAGAFTINSSTLYASNGASAFVGTSTVANVSISGILIGSTSGHPAVYCAKWRVGTSPTGSYIVQSLDGISSTFTWYGADFNGFGQASVTDVRSGVSYAAGSLTGTAAIPAAGSVALGVPVDDTTGTAVLTAAAVQTALTSYGASTLTKADVTNAVIPLV